MADFRFAMAARARTAARRRRSSKKSMGGRGGERSLSLLC